ncbi:hypothetical protein M0804_000650 [Polistes exclamans]|nr:hypothetical protein M0804_000650 [Polistes exclamans]
MVIGRPYGVACCGWQTMPSEHQPPVAASSGSNINADECIQALFSPGSFQHRQIFKYDAQHLAEVASPKAGLRKPVNDLGILQA